MKGTLGTFVCRALMVSALTLSPLALANSAASASSARATAGASTCDIVVNPSVRIVSKVPCVVEIRLGGNARLNLRAGFRWGNPTSTTRAVTVTSISRNSTGVVSAVLHAAKVGRATIRDTGTEICKATTPCPALALLWTLRIEVTKTL
jgi:hypothetical protein